MLKNLGFIGLGTMGSPIAENMRAAGFTLTVYNRSAERADALVARGARRATSPRACADGAAAVVTMVSDDEALEAVAFGADGLVAGLQPGAIHVNMTTTSAAVAGLRET